MNGKRFVGQRASSLTTYDVVGPVTGIALIVDDENEYLSGDQNGYVLEVHSQYGTQTMADELLTQAKGKVYKGYRAENAVLSPDAELGDGVTVGGIYSILAYQNVQFGPGHMSEIAAPGESTINHEYEYVSPERRETKRQLAQTRSTITKTAEQIRAEIQNELEGQSAAFELSINNAKLELHNEITGQAATFEASLEGIRGSIEAANGSISEIEVNLEGLRTYVDDQDKQITAEFQAGINGMSSTLRQEISSGDAASNKHADDAVSGLNNTVTERFSQISQTLEGITTTVSETQATAKGTVERVSTLEQTVDGFKTTVEGIDGRVTVAQQTADKISWLVDSGTSSTNFTLTDRTVELISDKIDLTGYVTFSSLESSGTTNINGDNITTGTLRSVQMNIADNFIVDEKGDLTINGNINLSGGSITWGNNRPTTYVPPYITSTGITETSIWSPTIYANSFNVYPGQAGDTPSLYGDGSFNIFGEFGTSSYSKIYHMLSIYYFRGSAPYLHFASPAGVEAWWDFQASYFGGIIRFQDNTTIDFTKASVTGLPASVAVFG